MVKNRRQVPDYFVSRGNTIKQILFTTFFAYLFINLYEPFGAREEYDVSEWLFFGASGLLVLAGMLVVISCRLVLYLIKRGRAVLIKDYVILVAAEILFMGFLYANLQRLIIDDYRPFLLLLHRAVQNTSLILLIPYLISLLYFAWRENKVTLDALIRQLRDKPQFISFKDENGVLRFTIKAQDLLFLEASDNYVVINYNSGSAVKTFLLRNTLKNIEQYLADFPLLRCHRSFMVNVDRVKILKREKGKLVLCMDENGLVMIPVSRGYANIVTTKFELQHVL